MSCPFSHFLPSDAYQYPEAYFRLYTTNPHNGSRMFVEIHKVMNENTKELFLKFFQKGS